MTYGKPLNTAPLKPAVLHILLALSPGQMHGLGIADAIDKETGGEIRVGSGTLYRSLTGRRKSGDSTKHRPAAARWVRSEPTSSTWLTTS